MTCVCTFLEPDCDCLRSALVSLRGHVRHIKCQVTHFCSVSHNPSPSSWPASYPGWVETIFRWSDFFHFRILMTHCLKPLIWIEVYTLKCKLILIFFPPLPFHNDVWPTCLAAILRLSRLASGRGFLFNLCYLFTTIFEESSTQNAFIHLSPALYGHSNRLMRKCSKTKTV